MPRLQRGSPSTRLGRQRRAPGRLSLITGLALTSFASRQATTSASWASAPWQRPD